MPHKTAFYVSAILIGIVLSFYALAQIFMFSQALDTTASIEGSSLTSTSSVKKTDGRTRFALVGKDKFLFKSRDSDLTAVYDVLKRKVNVNSTQINAGVAPSDLSLARTADDSTDPVLKKAGKNVQRKHYQFKQKVNGLPLYASSLAVHVAEGNSVYALTGDILDNPSLKPSAVSEPDAVNRATARFKQTYKTGAIVAEHTKEAVNPNLANISRDTGTYPSEIVTVTSTNKLIPPTKYIVSLTDGSILQEIQLAETALDRQVNDCAGSSNGNCNTVRTEGSSPSGIPDADNAYDFMGTIYNYYLSQHQRDSYDSSGGLINMFVNLPDVINNQQFCPNALWVAHTSSSANQLQVCPGLAAEDVIGHEFTHGVVEYTAGLGYDNESGAMNEGIADTFASGMDGNWTIGESSRYGAFRHLDDPTKNTGLASGQPNPMPDKLYSQYTYCGTSDRGGIHHNMSIPTKAHYLMSAGGSFNGCSMTGMGLQKSLTIWYQALSKYLFTTANFLDEYNAVMQACSDLYGANSTECTTTKNALQAVEMDQQTAGDQKPPSCSGGTERQPACVGLVQNPTDTPAPQATNTPVPTGQSCNTVSGDANHDGVVNLTDFEVWRRAFVGQ